VKPILVRTTTAVCAAALMAILAGCAPAEVVPEQPVRGPLDLTIGALVPDTGTIDWAGPTSRAAVQLALDDINDAGFPITVAAEFRDSGDSASEVGLASTTELLGVGVDAIVGPISNGVSRTILEDVIEAGIPLVSPGNDATDFTAFDDEGFYFRTSASCTLQGETLAQEIADSGATTAAIVATSDTCAEPLVSTITTALERLNIDITSSTLLDEGVAIDPASLGLSPAETDAVAVVSRALPEAVTALEGAGFASDDLYFALPSPRDYSGDLPEGALFGATVTRAGVDPTTIPGFADRLAALDERATSLTYAAETYDAIVLVALASFEANSTDGAAIAGALQGVSGGVDGAIPCTTFAACAASIAETGRADYDGLSGPISFDDNGDATGAVVGVYTGTRATAFDRAE